MCQISLWWGLQSSGQHVDNKSEKKPRNLTHKRTVKQGRIEYGVEDLELVRKGVLQRSGGGIPGRGHSTCKGPRCFGSEESCGWSRGWEEVRAGRGWEEVQNLVGCRGRGNSGF